MSKFSIDYQSLSNVVEKNSYKLADVNHRLEKVAFDLVRFKDGNPDELWQIQSADDGEYIVAKYSDEVEKKASSPWEVVINKNSSEINIFYKNHPITKIASAEVDLSSVKRFLPEKLASDKNFSKALIASLDTDTQKKIVKLFPELL